VNDTLETERFATLAAVIGIVLVPVIFFVDLDTPLGYAGGMPYVVPIVLGLWAGRRTYTVLVAAAATALTVVGYLASDVPASVPWTVYLNRAVAIGGQWIAAFVVLHHVRTHAALQRSRARVRVQNRERQLLIEQLEAKNAELEQFTYTVSHDLKSPLVTIKGFLGLLDQDVTEGDLARFRDDLARIDAAADRMHQLLDELLELSRVGRIAAPAEDVALVDLAGEVVESLSGVIQDAGVEVVVARDLPVVRGDRTRLRQVLQNLVDNAIKFMGDQPSPRIEIGVRRHGVDAICFVRDNGPGIDPRYADKVFGLFERFDTDRPGTGIGLALVRRIVEVHGGRVWVESHGDGAGACFLFTIPLAG